MTRQCATLVPRATSRLGSWSKRRMRLDQASACPHLLGSVCQYDDLASSCCMVVHKCPTATWQEANDAALEFHADAHSAAVCCSIHIRFGCEPSFHCPLPDHLQC